MHEVIGHASGKQADGKANPQALIKEHFSALEEGRADLVGLYFIADPKLVEIGVIPAADHDDMVRAEYEAYTRNALVQLRRVREGTQIEEDHMRNRQMIVRWLMANTKAIESRTRDGKSYLVMVDPKAFRDGVGRLLAEVQRIKSEGDAAGAAKLFDTYGIHFDAEAARRNRRARRQAEPAVVQRLRHAEADAGDRRGRIHHRRDDLLSAGLDQADAGVLGRSEGADFSPSGDEVHRLLHMRMPRHSSASSLSLTASAAPRKRRPSTPSFQNASTTPSRSRIRRRSASSRAIG